MRAADQVHGVEPERLRQVRGVPRHARCAPARAGGHERQRILQRGDVFLLEP